MHSSHTARTPGRPLAEGAPRRPHLTRRHLYPALLIVVYAGWLALMTLGERWGLFATYWPISLTMLFGSVIAGSTAAGSAAVAFPVFTKLFAFPADEARTFGLMIQSCGMGMASLVILTSGARVLPRVIAWTSLGGVAGMLAGTFLVAIPQPYPKVLFTFATSIFILAVAGSAWWPRRSGAPAPLADVPGWNLRKALLFAAVGALGGLVSATVGSGIDMLVFLVLTLAFGVDERVSTATSVPIMALNSALGFLLHGAVLSDAGPAWDYWMVALPVVIVGAPLGATILSRLRRNHVVACLVALAAIELATTLWLVPLTPQVLAVSAAFVAACGAALAGMLAYRAASARRG